MEMLLSLFIGLSDGGKNVTLLHWERRRTATRRWRITWHSIWQIVRSGIADSVLLFEMRSITLTESPGYPLLSVGCALWVRARDITRRGTPQVSDTTPSSLESPAVCETKG